MRIRELICEAKQEMWWDQPIPTLERMRDLKSAFLASPGTDPEYQDMIDILPHLADKQETDETIMSAFFDHLIDTFSRLSKRGFIEVYRCISVPDLKKFLSKIENPKTKLGIFWSHNPGAADCNYHPDANHKYEITLVAKAPVSSIDWGQTFTTNFGHPMEEEVTVMGPVSGLRVIHDEQIVFTSSKTFATA